MEQINILTKIDLKEIIGELCNQLSNEEIIQFIKNLEECAEDWEITENLYEHFSDLHKIYNEEVELE